MIARSLREAIFALVRPSATIAVLIMPGQIAVTPILCAASSSRSDSENPRTANLLATYAVRFAAA
ncbi:hypothetical protein D3C83_173400 [compost metagenome]